MSSAAVGMQSVIASASQEWRAQQASRGAEQAEATARALRRQASAAQREADQAQESARDLKVRSDQAEGRAGEARRSVHALESLGQTNTAMESLREGIGNALQTLDVAPATPPAPVVNTEGQVTGTLINVVA